MMLFRHLMVFLFICAGLDLLMAQDTSTMLKQCSCSVSWMRRGEDAVVTVTVKNGTKKTLVDPVVRVRFYNADSIEVASDAKMYFTRIKPQASKRLEARIWQLIPPDAAYARGALDAGVLE
ncbi:MAG: hypothetical protein HYX66_05265 [Ignavibacteria bacterium]|nr:hypothetical protein [Ignavibacteria bacterium]